MHDLAKAAIRDRFHRDQCTITSLPRAGSTTFDDTTFVVTKTAGTIHYQGPCHVDERSGFRRSEVGEAPVIMQGAEVRISALPDTVEVGMQVVLDRLPTQPFEIRELSKGTNELTTTLLVERAHQLPPTG